MSWSPRTSGPSAWTHERWGDWIPRKVVEDEIYEVVYTGGVERGGGRELQDAMAAAVGMTAKEFFDLLQSLRVPGGHDPHARIADIDADGIDAAVIYPSQAMFYGPVDPIEALHDIEFVTDCIRAYNDWIAEFCSAHPKRLFAMAGVPLQDVDRAIAEAERAVRRARAARRVHPARRRTSSTRPAVSSRSTTPCTTRSGPRARSSACRWRFHPGVHVDTPGACRKFGLVADSPNMIGDEHGDGRDPRRLRRSARPSGTRST